MHKVHFFILPALAAVLSCQPHRNDNEDQGAGNHPVDSMETFAYDYDLLQRHSDVILLERDSVKVAVVGAYQGRVMTSTANGWQGLSYGWINHELIRSGAYQPHMHPFGGEERFWLGPEGGQFALFFPKGEPFDLEHWQTPGAIDTMKYELVSQTAEEVAYRKNFILANYSGTTFHIQVDRSIRLLDRSAAENLLGALPEGLRWVGYETANQITNIGNKKWDRASGAVSIWLLGMMKASSTNTILIPYQAGGANEVNASYFGEVPADRLIRTDSLLFFRGDAQYRSKIGIPPAIVKPVAGSYDVTRQVLTVVHFDYDGATDYVNSMWEIQEFPFRGDVINAYNDGPNEAGGQLGAFYELETSSPALFLASGESGAHVQRTFHFEGEKTELDQLCRQLFGVGLP